MTTLKQKSILAFAWDFLGLLATRGAGFFVSIFLARLLSPQDFGLVGMGMAFISISQVFVDVGFSSALIQRKEASEHAFSSVFYFNIFAGLILFLLFFFLAPFIALFYNHPEVEPLVQWLSLNFLFNSFGLVQKATLIKSLKFKSLSIKNLAASIVGGTLGVIAAYNGFGVYALVIQYLSSSLVGTCLLWWFSSWRPSLMFSVNQLREMIGFSSYVFFDKMIDTFFQKLDVFIIAKVLSPATLGFYSRAVSLKDQVTTYSSASIQKIFFPILSSIQDEPKEYERVFFKVLSVAIFVSFLLTGWLMIFGSSIIIGLFGTKWESSVPIFQILILGVCTYPINSMIVNAFISKGRSKENFKIGLIRKLIRLFPLSLLPFYDIHVFAIAFVGVTYLLTMLNILFVQKHLDMPFSKSMKNFFDGILPFAPFVIVFYMLNFQGLKEKIFFGIIFTVVYYLYHSIRQTVGFVFIRTNLISFYSKTFCYKK